MGLERLGQSNTKSKILRGSHGCNGFTRMKQVLQLLTHPRFLSHRQSPISALANGPNAGSDCLKLALKCSDSAAKLAWSCLKIGLQRPQKDVAAISNSRKHSTGNGCIQCVESCAASSLIGPQVSAPGGNRAGVRFKASEKSVSWLRACGRQKLASEALIAFNSPFPSLRL